jgi:hypothetical protein
LADAFSLLANMMPPSQLLFRLPRFTSSFLKLFGRELDYVIESMPKVGQAQ